MNRKSSPLGKLIQQARDVPASRSASGGESAAEFPPELATRIAARWAAERSAASPSRTEWERLSWAGLAVALVIGLASVQRRPAVVEQVPLHPGEAAAGAELSLLDLLDAPVGPDAGI